MEVRKGAWTKEEDHLLRNYIEKHGEGIWHKVPPQAGLNRCKKGCRMRWLNYLKPNIKRGDFAEDEVDLMIRLQKLLGNKQVLPLLEFSPIATDFYKWLMSQYPLIMVAKGP